MYDRQRSDQGFHPRALVLVRNQHHQNLTTISKNVCDMWPQCMSAPTPLTCIAAPPLNLEPTITCTEGRAAVDGLIVASDVEMRGGMDEEGEL